MTDTIEYRDGRPFRVTVLPDQKTRPKTKPMMSRRMARGLAMGSGPSNAQRAKRRRRRKRKLMLSYSQMARLHEVLGAFEPGDDPPETVLIEGDAGGVIVLNRKEDDGGWATYSEPD